MSISAQPDSPLLGVAYEIRLAIYSFLTLPPLEECTEIGGLFLSCRQLKLEIEQEATPGRHLRLRLEKMEKRTNRAISRGHRFW